MLYIELSVVIVLICLNGLLAMAELAVISSRRNRLRALTDRGVGGARRALALASDPGKFLSTVQIGITLVAVVSGAFSGATLGQRLADWLRFVGLSPTMAELIGVGLVVAVIAYASLVVGELVPKQIALRNPERIAAKVAPAMTALSTFAAPIVFILDTSGRALLRALGYKARPEHTVSEEEIRTLIAEAESAGVIEPEEGAMISSVMRLGDRRVRALMTPRPEVDMVDLSDDPQVVRDTILGSVHSRLPVHEGKPDDVVGVVQAKDLLNAYMRGDQLDLRAQIKQVPVIPDSVDVIDALEIIKQSDVHMALIVDEYGHFEGIMTSADVLETIVGEFQTEEGSPEPDAILREGGSWLISGSMPADEMAERLAIALPKDRTYQTAAGFVVSHLKHLPSVGECIDLHDWRIEVVDMDGRRVDKILASRKLRSSRRRAT